MENQNNSSSSNPVTPTPAPQVVPPVPPSAPIPTPPPVKPVTTSKLKAVLNKIPFLQDEAGLPIKKLSLMLGGVFVLLVMLIVVATILNNFRFYNQVVQVGPTPEPSFAPATPIPSRYATDSAVLKIEENINVLDKELAGTDIDEVNLKPRKLNWDVNFNR